MENFTSFPSNTTQPCRDVQDISSFLQVQTPDGEIQYPNTQDASPLSQIQQLSSYLEQASEMNFEPSQNAVPYEIPFGVPTEVSSHSEESLQTQESDENRRLQAKIARANRKLALQMSTVRSSSGTSRKTRKKPYSQSKDDEDRNIFYTPDNLLRVVVQKLLTSSDVSDQGRILLPKKEVEENLPGLATREGVLIVMKEVFSYTKWRMKYRYWANHKGKIYLFDQCDDFVQKNLLEAGDQLNLYQDEQKNLYFTIKKKEIHSTEACNNYISETTEEEESLSILMEELKHKDEEEPTTLTSLYNTGGSPAERNYSSH